MYFVFKFTYLPCLISSTSTGDAFWTNGAFTFGLSLLLLLMLSTASRFNIGGHRPGLMVYTATQISRAGDTRGDVGDIKSRLFVANIVGWWAGRSTAWSWSVGGDDRSATLTPRPLCTPIRHGTPRVLVGGVALAKLHSSCVVNKLSHIILKQGRDFDCHFVWLKYGSFKKDWLIFRSLKIDR